MSCRYGVFDRTLGRAERSLAQELRDVHNHWMHEDLFTGDDAYRTVNHRPYRPMRRS